MTRPFSSQSFSAALLGCVIVACGGDEGGSEGPFLRFVTPEPGGVLTGAQLVEVDYRFDESVAAVEFGFEGELGPLKFSPPRQVNLDTSRMEDGPRTLQYRVVFESGAELIDSVEVVVDNPDHYLRGFEPNQLSYANGDTLLLTLDYGEPGLTIEADLSDLDSEFAGSAASVADLGDGRYELSYTLAEGNVQADGTRVGVITATNAAGESTRHNVDVELANVPPLPVVVLGGTFTKNLPVQLVEADAPAVTAVRTAPTILTGGEVNLGVDWSNSEGSAANRIVVAAEGYAGYYVLPVDADAETTELRLSLPKLKPELDGVPLNLLIGAIDPIGRTLLWINQQIVLRLVGTGKVQVTLTWNNGADLDLGVTDPMGRTVNWRQEIDGGGQIDLDSNSECLSNFVSAENIFWPDGTEIPGRYQVHVNLFDACGELSADYEGTITFCGRTRTFSGTRLSTDVNEDLTTLGPVVETFDLNCSQRAFGKLRFEKRKTVPGPGSSLPASASGNTPVPARFVPVRAVRVSDGACLAYTLTNAEGEYDLRFVNDADPQYIVVAEAQWGQLGAPSGSNACGRLDPKLEVVRDTGALHTFASAAIDGQAEPEKQLDITIPERPPTGAAATDARGGRQSSGGAFNILDTALEVTDWYATRQGDTLSKLRFRWSDGVALPSAYTGGSNPSIALLGDADHDEWDDSIIAHEFLHFIMDKKSRDDSPGGAVNHSGQPAASWSEGGATGLGQIALDSPLFIDSRENPGGGLASGGIDIETLAGVTPGTVGGTQNGNVNEFIVAGVLWDLIDPASSEAHASGTPLADNFDTHYFGVLGATFQHLRASGRRNRGFAGADLVDFLDGFVCKTRELAIFGGPAVEPDLAQLLNHPSIAFPYDQIATGTPPPALTCF